MNFIIEFELLYLIINFVEKKKRKTNKSKKLLFFGNLFIIISVSSYIL